MNPSAHNTILITGGGSGIGRGLAEAFHKLGNKVIIAGRRKEVLETVTAANPGMDFAVLDVQDSAKLASFVDDITAKYPTLNVLINMAGVMKPENFADSTDTSAADEIIATNLTAPIHLTAALLPLLKQQPEATVMTVTSGLAFVPLAMTPTYCATKAAMHSWSISLRYQLRNTSVDVLELAPPYVQTETSTARSSTHSSNNSITRWQATKQQPATGAHAPSNFSVADVSSLFSPSETQFPGSLSLRATQAPGWPPHAPQRLRGAPWRTSSHGALQLHWTEP